MKPVKTGAQWLSINPSELRHQVQIQARTSAQDTAGQPVDTWNTVGTVRAKLETLNQQQYFQQGELTSQVSHKLTIRYTSLPITAGMQVLFGARKFKIQAMAENVDERNTLMRILCLEIAGL